MAPGLRSPNTSRGFNAHQSTFNSIRIPSCAYFPHLFPISNCYFAAMTIYVYALPFLVGGIAHQATAVPNCTSYRCCSVGIRSPLPALSFSKSRQLLYILWSYDIDYRSTPSSSSTSLCCVRGIFFLKLTSKIFLPLFIPFLASARTWVSLLKEGFHRS